MTELERFRETIEKFISAKGITPTQFGREYAGDPLFVFQLREGREPRSRTRQRILASLAAPSTPTGEEAA